MPDRELLVDGSNGEARYAVIVGGPAVQHDRGDVTIQRGSGVVALQGTSICYGRVSGYEHGFDFDGEVILPWVENASQSNVELLVDDTEIETIEGLIQ